MKVSDKVFEGGKYPFSCSIYDWYGLCIFTEYKQYQFFVLNDFSVLIIGLNSALR